MRIRDVKLDAVASGENWRVLDAAPAEMIDWEIEPCATFDASDMIVYSALTVLDTGVVVPLLVIREVGAYEWWGDMCEYVDGAWRLFVGPPMSKSSRATWLTR